MSRFKSGARNQLYPLMHKACSQTVNLCELGSMPRVGALPKIDTSEVVIEKATSAWNEPKHGK